MHPSVCVVSWMGLTNLFEAGMNASILILPKDAFGNNLSFSGKEIELHGFSLSLLYENGSFASILNVTHMRWIESGYISIDFVLVTAGKFVLLVERESQNLNGAPLPLEVNSGPLDVSNCVSIWKSELNAWQIFSKMEILLHQKDRFGNLVSGFYEFDADVVEEKTGLSILHKKSISGMPYAYAVYIGYCDASRSIVNGSGINVSIARESLGFTIYLKDAYGTGSSYSTTIPFYEKYGGKASGNLVTQASIFDVTYTPKRSGVYKIFISSGNIVLNGGQPFIKEIMFLIWEMFTLIVCDQHPLANSLSYYNHVPSQPSRLKLEITSANTSSFTTWEFVDNNDGTYTGSYLAMEVDGYFPRAYDDAVNVWEDESISFNPLENDYFVGDNASILGFSQVSHGSLLRDGNLLRYTPFKDFSGNDSFLYTMVDINENLATATVYTFILTAPPQFISFSGGLQTTEDLISPRSGQVFFILFCFGSGFSRLEISYSDLLENISVMVQALSGSVILSPMLMQFRLPASGRLSLSTRNKNGINHLDDPVFVEPVNDPPFINVPQYIMLESNGDESLIFHRETDKFNFSVGDLVLTNFPGGESHFLVTFSVEVTDGFLLTNLPAELINSTEPKLKNIFQWQPIQTYVAKHVNVKASGIRLYRKNFTAFACGGSRKPHQKETFKFPYSSCSWISDCGGVPCGILSRYFVSVLHMQMRISSCTREKRTICSQEFAEINGCLPKSIWNRHLRPRHMGETSGKQIDEQSPEINIVPLEIEKATTS
ncbi:unnamed protein product [Arabis nemorensis]|uniref:GEX2 N-terminal Ig-like domain-containing protein n=1 Tax=Arabis nemorensis TaxID=586526 RepID=A0A565AWV5_9BRAS|nr:unnamed protein product [Arabis nemorensis]